VPALKGKDKIMNALENENQSGVQEVEPWLEHCPITHRPFFMMLDHPEHGNIPTFGGPLDSYTIPFADEDGDLHCERYDHDAGEWVEGGESLRCWLTTKQPDDRELPEFVKGHWRVSSES
jgi:hypothetical protein